MNIIGLKSNLIFSVFCHFGIFCYIVLQLLPLILDIILPLSESRTYKVIAITEYFVNREKYICVMILHEMLTFYVAVITVCSTIMLIMMYILHGCALFEITWYYQTDLIFGLIIIKIYINKFL